MLTVSPFWPLGPGVPSNPSSLVSLWEEIPPQRSENRMCHHFFTVTIYLPQWFRSPNLPLSAYAVPLRKVFQQHILWHAFNTPD